MEPNWSGALMVVIFVGLVVVGLFVLCREFFCWYWKINEGLDLLRQIRDRLPAPGGSAGVEGRQRPEDAQKIALD